MTTTCAALFLVTASTPFLVAADKSELQGRRQRAATALGDGVLIVHAKSATEDFADGFHQNAAFYYFTGLENILGAILTIDGRSHDSWLFLPPRPADSGTLPPEGSPVSEAVKRAGIEHVVDWSELDGFLKKNSSVATTLYYLAPGRLGRRATPNLAGATPDVPLWAITIAMKWPSYQLKEFRERIQGLIDVQSPSEMADVRGAAKATVPSGYGRHARRSEPGVEQRSVEPAVADDVESRRARRCILAMGDGRAEWCFPASVRFLNSV